MLLRSRSKEARRGGHSLRSPGTSAREGPNLTAHGNWPNQSRAERPRARHGEKLFRPSRINTRKKNYITSAIVGLVRVFCRGIVGFAEKKKGSRRLRIRGRKGSATRTGRAEPTGAVQKSVGLCVYWCATRIVLSRGRRRRRRSEGV